MFQEMMSLNSNVCTVNYSPHTYKETHHWLKASVILNSDKRLFYENKIYDGYGSKKNAKILIKSTLLKNLKNYRFWSDDKKMIFDGWEALCDKLAQPVFFEKSPQHLNEWGALSLLLEWINMTKYDVKIIGLVRNPIRVLNSAHNLFGSNPNIRQYRWLNCYKNLILFRSLVKTNQFKLVKYEDILIDPRKNVKDICDFVGINYEASMIKNIALPESNKNEFSVKFKLHEPIIRLAKYYEYSNDDLEFNFKEENSSKLKFFRLIFVIRKFKNRLYYRVFVPLKEKISIIFSNHIN